MQLYIEPEAEEDIRDLEKSHQEYVLNRLQELRDQPTGHKDSDTIRIRDRQVFKYVMKKDNTRGGKDYRAIYDINGENINIIAIFNRDQGYNKKELNNRL